MFYHDEEQAAVAANSKDSTQTGESDERSDADQNNSNRFESCEAFRVVVEVVWFDNVSQPCAPVRKHLKRWGHIIIV